MRLSHKISEIFRCGHGVGVVRLLYGVKRPDVNQFRVDPDSGLESFASRLHTLRTFCVSFLPASLIPCVQRLRGRAEVYGAGIKAVAAFVVDLIDIITGHHFPDNTMHQVLVTVDSYPSVGDTRGAAVVFSGLLTCPDRVPQVHCPLGRPIAWTMNKMMKRPNLPCQKSRTGIVDKAFMQVVLRRKIKVFHVAHYNTESALFQSVLL